MLTHDILLSSANNLCKQIGPRPGPTKHQAWSVSDLFDAQMVLRKEFFEKAVYEKNQQTTKKHEKHPKGKMLNNLKIYVLSN